MGATFRFPCPSCGSTLEAATADAGLKLECQRCGHVSEVPKPSDEPADDPDDDEPPTYERPRRTVTRPSPRRRRAGDPLADFLTFRRMVAPYIVFVVFWMGVVGICWLCGKHIYHAESLRDAAEWVFALPFALLLWRLMCENAIIFYRIHEELRAARHRR